MKIEKRNVPSPNDSNRPKRSFQELFRKLPPDARVSRPKRPEPPTPRLAGEPFTLRDVLPGARLAPNLLQGLPTAAVQIAALADRKLADSREHDAQLGLGRAQSERFDSVLALAHTETQATQETHQVVDLRDRLFEALERQSASIDSREPKRSEEPVASTPAVEQPGAVEQTGPTAPPREPSRSEAVMAMVEKIELVLRSQAPGLALELNGAAAAHLEVTRTGPKEITILLRARGASERRELERSCETLRTALAGRGVRVRSLEIV